MASYTVTVSSNAGQVRRFFVERADGLRLWGTSASLALAKNIKTIVSPILQDETPKVSGELAGTTSAMFVRSGEGIRVVWTSSSKHAKFVLEGTGLYHVPDAHSAWDVNKFQAFVVGGQLVMTMHTHHEGQKPSDYPDRAMQRAKGPLDAAIRLVGDKLMVEFDRRVPAGAGGP